MYFSDNLGAKDVESVCNATISDFRYLTFERILPGMIYRKIEPSNELTEIVQYFWTIDLGEDLPSDSLMKSIVDDSSGIIIHHNNGQAVVQVNGHQVPTAVIYGQSTMPDVVEIKKNFFAIGVLFHPHAIHRLFSIDSILLSNKILNLNDVTNVGTMTDNLINSHGIDNQIAVLSNFLIDRLRKSRSSSKRVLDIINYIKSNKGLFTVRQIADHHHCTERSLERLFLKYVGVTPRHYLQAIRFKTAVQMLKNEPKKKLTDIAIDLNFNDLPHFTNVVKKLSGNCPRSLRVLLDEYVVDLFIRPQK